MIERPLNILLADDDKDDRLFFEMALNGITGPTRLTTASDGEQLMLYLTQHMHELPDAIFLDLNMPRKNGFECLSELKSNDSLKHLPVIIFSTSLEQDVVSLLYQNGAHFYIRKPAEYAKLLLVIQLIMNILLDKNLQKPARDKFVLTVQDSMTI